MFSSAHIPVFFSQYGNAEIPARPFFDTRAIYTNDEMLRVFSGGVVYEFFDGPGRFGLVRHATSHGTVHLKKLNDFSSLKTVLDQFFPPPRLEQRTAKMLLPPPPPPAEEEPALDPSYAVISRKDLDAPSSSSARTAAAPARRDGPPMPRRTAEWQASHRIPESPMDWAELEAQIEENIKDSEWTDVQKDMLDMAVDELAFGIRDKLIIDDDSHFGAENGGDLGNDYKKGRACRVS